MFLNSSYFICPLPQTLIKLEKNYLLQMFKCVLFMRNFPFNNTYTILMFHYSLILPDHGLDGKYLSTF